MLWLLDRSYHILLRSNQKCPAFLLHTSKAQSKKDQWSWYRGPHNVLACGVFIPCLRSCMSDWNRLSKAVVYRQLEMFYKTFVDEWKKQGSNQATKDHETAEKLWISEVMNKRIARKKRTALTLSAVMSLDVSCQHCSRAFCAKKSKNKSITKWKMSWCLWYALFTTDKHCHREYNLIQPHLIFPNTSLNLTLFLK